MDFCLEHTKGITLRMHKVNTNCKPRCTTASLWLSKSALIDSLSSFCTALRRFVLKWPENIASRFSANCASLSSLSFCNNLTNTSGLLNSDVIGDSLVANLLKIDIKENHDIIY